MYLYKTIIPSPLGSLIAFAYDEGLSHLFFTDSRDTTQRLWALEKKPDITILNQPNPILQTLNTQLTQYFEGTRFTFSIPLAPHGTSFQQEVWTALTTIPLGKIYSYSDMATRINKPTAHRAVANANRLNPIAIIIPCHRIIKKNGELCGYNGGIERKKWLLNHEAGFKK